MKAFVIRLVVCIFVLVPILSSCSGYHKPQKRNCGDAMECVGQKGYASSVCEWSTSQFGYSGLPNDVAMSQRFLFNYDSTRDIRVWYQPSRVTQNPNLGPPPASRTAVLPVKPKDGGNTGGPDLIDSAGPGLMLGCRYVVYNNYLEMWSWTVTKACYVDDVACNAAPPSQKPEEPPVDQVIGRCDMACSGGSDRTCLQIPIGNKYPQISSGLHGIYRKLVSIKPPMLAPLDPLLHAINLAGGVQCDSRTLAVDAAYVASASGPACSGSMPMGPGNTQGVSRLDLRVPFDLAGMISTDGQGAKKRARWSFGQGTEPYIDYFLRQTGDVYPHHSERVGAVAIAADSVIVAGDQEFCARITYQADR